MQQHPITTQPELEIHSNKYSLAIEQELKNKIDSIVDRYNTDTANFLRTCWYILLWKLTEVSDITIANLFDGRKYEQLNDTLGLLAHFLPINCTISKQFTVQEVISTLKNNQNTAEQKRSGYFLEKNYFISLTIGFEFDNLPNKHDVEEYLFL